MLNGIKSKIVLKKIFQHVKEGIYLKLLNHNKNIQSKLNLSFDRFKKYSNKIIIEIIPTINSNYHHKFINFLGNKSNYHIFFDAELEERKDNFFQTIYFTNEPNVNKIKVIIDGDDLKSLEGLFNNCDYVEKKNFIKFNKTDITNMNNMFRRCESLINLNIAKLKTDNVTSMKNMFQNCSSLEKLNLSNFKTDKVTNMENMFFNCIKLENLNLSNFKTNNVINMNNLFYNCYGLEYLDLSNFQNENISEMKYMFSFCQRLRKI